MLNASRPPPDDGPVAPEPPPGGADPAHAYVRGADIARARARAEIDPALAPGTFNPAVASRLTMAVHAPPPLSPAAPPAPSPAPAPVDVGAEPPLVVVAEVGSSRVLAAVDAAAAGLGLHPGLTLKAARARVPHLRTASHNPTGDAEWVERLLRACRRLTPTLARAPGAPAALVLDIAGCAELHGGEPALVEAAGALFARAGLALRWGLADTPELAAALARHAASGETGGVRLAPGAGTAALSALPVEALGLPPADLDALTGLGLRRIGEVLSRPRAALSAALDGRLGERLDALTGARAPALTAELEPPRHLAQRRLPGAVVDHHAVGRHVRRLAEALERSLEGRGVGARRLLLDLWGPEGTHRRVTVRTPEPVRRAADVARLFAHRLELLGEGAAGPEGVDQLRLHAVETAPLTAVALDLDAPEAAGGFEAFARFVTARYGEAALERVRADPATAKPEREARLRPWSAPWRSPRKGDPAPPPPAWGEAVTRPLRLLDPPEPVEVLAGVPDDPPATLVWRRVRRRVVRATGPERFAPEWGREPEGAGARDYYRVEDEAGQRFWVFREGPPGDERRRWFLHGLFA